MHWIDTRGMRIQRMELAAHPSPAKSACRAEQSRPRAHVRRFPCISLCETGSPRLPGSCGRCYCCIHHSWPKTLGPDLSTTALQKLVAASCFFCTLLANIFITLTKFKDILVCLEINQFICSPVLHCSCVWLHVRRKVYLLTVIAYSTTTKYKLKLITKVYSSWISQGSKLTR